MTMIKSFYLAITALSFSLLLLGCSYEQATEAETVTTMRTTQQLTTGWKFHFGELGEEASAADYDDAHWETVPVPHNWKRVGFYNNDLVDQINYRS